MYLSLSLTAAAASLASYLYMGRVLPDPGAWHLVPAVGLMLGVGAVPRRHALLRHLMLYGFGFVNGWGAGPLVRSVAFVDPQSIQTALIGTMVIFGSFTATAMLTERRSQLYLGGLLSAGLAALSWIGLAGLFFRAPALHSAELYLGLLVLAGFVAYDTQVIVEQAEAGQRDVPGDAMGLFTSLFGLFVRLLVLLAQDGGRRRRRRSAGSDDD